MQKRSKNLLENLVDSAVNEATEAMAKNRPVFTQEFILGYIDKKALNQYAREISEYIKEKKISPEEAYQALASHIVSGDLLTDEGKEMIVSKSLEEKARKWWIPGSRKAKKILEGEKYLNEVMIASRNIYNLIASDQRYAKRMPELAEAVATLHDLGFMNATVSALYRILPEDKYLALKEGIVKAAKLKPEERKRAIENYSTYIRDYSQGIAAAILTLFGLGILLTYNSITGNVIGAANNTNIPAVIIGSVLLLTGLYLGIRKGKEKTKQKIK